MDKKRITQRFPFFTSDKVTNYFAIDKYIFQKVKTSITRFRARLVYCKGAIIRPYA